MTGTKTKAVTTRGPLEPAREDAPSRGWSEPDLFAEARRGDEIAVELLLERYRRFAHYRARRYFIPGAEHEDLLQEALVGLFKAIKAFDTSRGPFTAFAGLCIDRQIHTAVKTANCLNHKLFRAAASLDASAFLRTDDYLPIIERLQSAPDDDPVTVVEATDEIERAKGFLTRTLTQLEAEVLRLHSQDKTYEEMATVLEMSIKGVDNALQRIKAKLRTFLADNDPEVEVQSRLRSTSALPPG